MSPQWSLAAATGMSFTEAKKFIDHYFRGAKADSSVLWTKF